MELVLPNNYVVIDEEEMMYLDGGAIYIPRWAITGAITPNHSYLSQLDVTYKTPDLMSHFLPPHEVSFTFCCSSIVFPR
ncbi:putative glutamine transport system permease protein [Streptococcus pneumoniae]|nr:putative glutamine transport system permease protein [Streptococcus pneumoniae]